MGPLIVQTWLRRLVLLVFVSIALVLLIHVPGGIVHEFGEQPSPLAPPEILSSSWQWSPYKAELSTFIDQLKAKQFEYYPEGSTSKRDFWPHFKQSWSGTARLVLKSFPLGAVLGVLIGMLYALRSRLPRLVSFVVSSCGAALPDFLIMALGHWMAIWFWSNHEIRIWYILADPNVPRGDLLPTIALAIIPMGLLARLTASVMDDVMCADYIRTARGKGVAEWRVVLEHGFKNAVPRIAAGFPAAIGLYMSSLITVERLSTWPGVVRWVVPTFYKRTFGYAVGEWMGPTPQIVSLVVVLLVACYILLEGLVNTMAIWANRHQLEVQK